MKRILLSVVLLLLLAPACTTGEGPIKYLHGKIIGFDPCSFYDGIPTGFVIVSNDGKTVLKTYNFPDTLYTFKKDYFTDYRVTSYLPVSVRDSFPVVISYTIAEPEEMVYKLCTADINTSEFPGAVQAVLRHAVKPVK